MGKEIYIYNSDNKLSVFQDYYLPSDVMNQTTFSYNEDGFIIKEVQDVYVQSIFDHTVYSNYYERDFLGRVTRYQKNEDEQYYTFEYTSDEFIPKESILGIDLIDYLFKEKN